MGVLTPKKKTGERFSLGVSKLCQCNDEFHTGCMFFLCS